MRGNVRPKALVAAWFDFLTDAQRDLAQQLQAAVRLGLGTAQEDVRWGNLVFSVHDQAVLALVPFRTHVNLQVYGQAPLPPGLPPLESAGRSGRHLKFRLGQAIDAAGVQRLAEACRTMNPPSAGPRTALRRDAAALDLGEPD